MQPRSSQTRRPVARALFGGVAGAIIAGSTFGLVAAIFSIEASVRRIADGAYPLPRADLGQDDPVPADLWTT